ncbi:MAG: HAD family hydrolase [Caldilinea sp. CFX5]|nr:HAD family hydrolase [Caldilinea sp. CFX5]
MAKHPLFDLVVLDLDGTVQDLFHAGVATPRVRAAIGAVQAAGIPLTVATGRTLDYVRTTGAYLNLTYPVITAHGAVIGDPQSGRMYAEVTMPLAVAADVAAWLDNAQVVTTLYINDDAGHTHLYQNRPAPDPTLAGFHDHIFGTPRTLYPHFQRLLTQPGARAPLKFLSDNDPLSAPDVLAPLAARFGETLYITRSHPRLVEGMAQGVNKGQALRQLCRMLHIDPQRVLAVGDNDNDIPLLQAAGYGVAMGNASPGLKAIADWIAPTIEDDGAAIALEKLVVAGSK